MKLIIFRALSMIIGALLAALVFLSFTAHAEEWTKPDLPCIPGLSDIARAKGSEGPVLAGVWWCDMPDGLHTRYATYTVTEAKVINTGFASAGEDLGPEILRFWTRASTMAEMELVTKLEIKHGPRCYVFGTGATTAVFTANAQGFIGPPKTDAANVGVRVRTESPVACSERLAKETAKRYCSAENLIDTKHRPVGPATWVSCKLERAPASGWGL